MSPPLPLAQLAAFEAAARRLSFTDAARELNVQQPAISRQVAALEALLDARLFKRTKPRLTLTAEGEALFRTVSDGFDAMRAEMRRIEAGRRDAPVVVNAPIGFTSLYLMPRLAEFQAMAPEHPIQIVTRDQNRGFDASDADVVVSFGTAGLPGAQSAPIFREELVPVAAPGLLPGDRPLPLERLLDRKLLHMSSLDHAEDWSRYLEGTGLRAPRPAPTERIMSYMVYLLSIQNGQGIGLGWRGLVERLLAEGRLVIGVERTVATGRAYWADLTPRARNSPGARAFWRWLTTGASGR
ncbi:MAG: LysR substrate-binding domain-containing protein [Pseudomonadota bacterium]